MKPGLKPDPILFCEHCGEQLARKRYNGRLEDPAVFLVRRFCNRSCMILSMISEDELTKNGYLQRAHKHRGKECELCGAKENLDAHHQDRDRSNNAPSNIQTLCRTCHMKGHWAREEIQKPVLKKPCIYCDDLASSRGLCEKHYARFRRTGDPSSFERWLDGRLFVIKCAPESRG